MAACLPRWNRQEIAVDAIRGLNGKNGWRVEMSRSSRGRGICGGRGRSDGDDLKCYECGEPAQFARECRLCIGVGGPSPRYWHSPSYGRKVAALIEVTLQDVVATHDHGHDGGEVTAGHLHFVVIVGCLHMLMGALF
ncbi:hypothetical protein SUGI_0659320 [Cryptomeria japonica]|nr:hypothetical protein SUGI_0659320 [Cryptomeria japonica]